MVEDDNGKPSEPGAFIDAATVEPEIQAALLLGSHLREELKRLGDLDASNVPEPPIESVDRPTSPIVPPPGHPSGPVNCEGGQDRAAAANPSSAIILLLTQQSQGIRRTIGGRL